MQHVIFLCGLNLTLGKLIRPEETALGSLSTHFCRTNSIENNLFALLLFAQPSRSL
jgi:hypothetical protein